MLLAEETKKDLKLFELSYPFTKIALKKKYRDLAFKYHSDRNQNVEHFSEEAIKEINIAYARLEKLALEEVNIETTLSEQLKKKFEREEEDIFTLFNPCSTCGGKRVEYNTITVAVNCPKCKGTSKVKLKCKYCDDGVYTNKRGKKGPCRACGGTGVWKEVFCNQCSGARKDKFWGGLFDRYIDWGMIYEEKQVERVCSECKGRGKVKYEPSNPVIKKGAILKCQSKKKSK